MITNDESIDFEKCCDDSMFDYTISQYVIAARQFAKLCQPLLDAGPMDKATYMWASKDRKITWLSTDENFLIDFLKHRYYIPFFSHIEFDHVKSGYYDVESLYVTDERIELSDKLKEKYSSYDKFVIIQKGETEIEEFGVSFPVSARQNISYCLNATKKLDDFFTSILPEVHKIISELVPLHLEFKPIEGVDTADVFAALHARNFLGHLNTKTQSNISLTEREKAILYHCLSGKGAKEIALSLHISYRTVENNLLRIKKKYSCKSINHLLSLFIDISEISL